MHEVKPRVSKIKKDQTRLAEDLRCSLETEILSGLLLPGERLDESGLAKRFGVSRTPVREALLQLASSGLIEMRPRQGAVVATVTVQDLMQMFEVMAELEAMCARLAARRINPVERAAIAAAHETCKTAARSQDLGAYYKANRVFHEALYAGAHNAYLQDKTRSLRNRLSAYRRYQLHQVGRVARSLAEHEAVVEALMAGDAEAAENAMRTHVAIQGDVFSDLISLLPPRYLQAAAK